jgi:hypothetical protein
MQGDDWSSSLRKSSSADNGLLARRKSRRVRRSSTAAKLPSLPPGSPLKQHEFLTNQPRSNRFGEWLTIANEMVERPATPVEEEEEEEEQPHVRQSWEDEDGDDDDDNDDSEASSEEEGGGDDPEGLAELTHTQQYRKKFYHQMSKHREFVNFGEIPDSATMPGAPAFLETMYKEGFNTPEPLVAKLDPSLHGEVNFSCYCMGNHLAKAFSASLPMLSHPVVMLNLADNRLTKVGLDSILGNLRMEGLQGLNLSRNDISESIDALSCIVEKSKTLRILTLEDCNLTDKTMTPLCAALYDSDTITNLNLSKNHMGERAAEKIAKFLSDSISIQLCSLSWNRIGGKTAALICEGLKSSVELDEIDLSWNAFGRGDDGAHALADALAANSVLKHCDLRHNNMNPSECAILAEGLESNHTLIGLHLAGNCAVLDGRGFLLPATRTPVQWADAATIKTDEELNAIYRNSPHGIIHRRVPIKSKSKKKEKKKPAAVEEVPAGPVEMRSLYYKRLREGRSVVGFSPAACFRKQWSSVNNAPKKDFAVYLTYDAARKGDENAQLPPKDAKDLEPTPEKPLAIGELFFEAPHPHFRHEVQSLHTFVPAVNVRFDNAGGSTWDHRKEKNAQDREGAVGNEGTMLKNQRCHDPAAELYGSALWPDKHLWEQQDHCWVCDNWREVTFTWVPDESEPEDMPKGEKIKKVELRAAFDHWHPDPMPATKIEIKEDPPPSPPEEKGKKKKKGKKNAKEDEEKPKPKKKKMKTVYECTRMTPPGLVQFCFVVNGRTVVAANIATRRREYSKNSGCMAPVPLRPMEQKYSNISSKKTAAEEAGTVAPVPDIVNFFEVQPRPEGEVIEMQPRTLEKKKKLKKEKAKWTFPISIFAPYNRDTEDSIADVFKYDYSHTKLPGIFKEEEEACKELFRKHYQWIKDIFKQYSAGGVDPYTMGWNMFTDLVTTCNLPNEADLSLASIDMIFIGSCLTGPKDKVRNPKRALARFQLMETLTKLALAKFWKKDGPLTRAQSIEKLLTEHIFPNAQKDDGNKWRWDRLYNEPCDMAFKAVLPSFHALYNKFSGRENFPGERKTMCKDEFTEMMECALVVDQTFTTREVVLCYVRAMQVLWSAC